MSEKTEATDALMAAVGEYAAPWVGDDLDPEIVDAEFCDCLDFPLSVKFPMPLDSGYYERLRRIHYSDIEAAKEALVATVTELADIGGWAIMFPEEMDADLYDCPSLKSLK